MDDFNCEFNAPMFVDFNNLSQHENEADPEAYFEVNHEDIPTEADNDAQKEEAENEVPKAATEEKPTTEANEAKKPKKNLVASWDQVFAPNNAKVGGVTREDTPTRKALRKVVAETIKAGFFLTFVTIEYTQYVL